MGVTDILTLCGALVAGLTGEKAWSYYKKRAFIASSEKMKDKEVNLHHETTNKKEIRELLDKQIEDLRAEVIKLKEANTLIDKEITIMTVKNAILTERLLSYSQKSRGNKKTTL